MENFIETKIKVEIESYKSFIFSLIGNDGYLFIEGKNYSIFVNNKILKSNTIKVGNIPVEIHLKNNSAKRNIISLKLINSSISFLPGSGSIPSHFKENSFPYNFILEQESEFHIFNPFHCKNILLNFSGIKNQDIFFLSDIKFEVKNPNNPWFSVLIKNNMKDKWITFRITKVGIPFHISILNTSGLIFGQKRDFPVFPLKVKIENQKNKIFRIDIMKNSEIVGVNFAENSKDASFYLPKGKYNVCVSCGWWFERKIKEILLEKPCEIKIKLKKIFSPDRRWKSVDTHIHSYYVDGSNSPEFIAKAGYSNGLDLLFLTDEDPEKIPGSGEIIKFKKQNFLPLPGQEIGAKKYHINVINNNVKIKSVNLKKIIDEVKKIKSPILLILNHPWTDKRNAKFLPYFKSWWVLDNYEYFKIVENYGLNQWFNRLNRGKKITGIWTTDSHDSVLIPPGDRRAFVYTGKKNLSVEDVLKGIEEGKVFCAREPGCWIEFKINRKIPGEIVIDKNLDFQIKVFSNEPIGKICIFFNNKKLKEFIVKGKYKFEKNFKIENKKTGWFVICVYSKIKKKFPSHSLEPLTKRNLLGFTNPIYVEIPKGGKGW